MMGNQKGFVILVLPVLILIIALAGGFYYLNKKLSSTANKNNDQQTSASQKSEESKFGISPTTSGPTPTLIPTPTKGLASNKINLNTAKVGDQVGALKIKEIAPFMEDRGPISENNATILFSGSVIITGEYKSENENAMGEVLNPVSLVVKDKSSLEKLPQIPYNNSVVWFALENNQFAIDNLGPIGKTGTATIEIENYRVNLFPAAVNNTAKLLQVVKKD